MSSYEDEQETERRIKLAEENKEFEELWKEHVKAVLSHTRIDPQHKGILNIKAKPSSRTFHLTVRRLMVK